MKRPHFILAVGLSLGCLFSAWMNWRLWQQIELLRLGIVSDEPEGLRRQIGAIQSAIARERASVIPPPGAKTGETVSAQKTGGPTASQDSGLEAFGLQMRDPAYRRLRAIVIQGEVDAELAGLYKLFNLPPDQLARYRELQVERRMALMDMVVLSHQAGMNGDSNPATLQKITDDTVGPIDAEVNQILGPDRIAAGMDWFRSASQRMVATQLQQSLSFSDSPLTDEQAGQLALILRQNPVSNTVISPAAVVNGDGEPVHGTIPNSRSFVVGLDGGVQFEASISTAAINAAAGVLSGSQIAALRALQEAQQSQRQLGVLQLREGAGPGHP